MLLIVLLLLLLVVLQWRGSTAHGGWRANSAVRRLDWHLALWRNSSVHWLDWLWLLDWDSSVGRLCRLLRLLVLLKLLVLLLRHCWLPCQVHVAHSLGHRVHWIKLLLLLWVELTQRWRHSWHHWLLHAWLCAWRHGSLGLLVLRGWVVTSSAGHFER